MAKFEMNVYLERWLQNRAYRAMPRMPNWVTQDDLVQEGKYCWTVVNDRYDDVVTEVAHMVALFKSTYQRRVVDIINDKRNARKEASLDQLVEDGIEFSELSSAAEISHLVLQAPEPMRTILRLLVTDEQRILSTPCRVYLDGTRETLNHRLHRALRRYDIDIEPDVDILARVRRYLEPKRERLYEEPSVVDIVGALVEERLTTPTPVRHPQLSLKPGGLVKARANLSKRQPKVNPRVRIFPVVEVKRYGKANRGHPQDRVRCRPSDPQPRQQVSARAWASVRPRVHGDWADCRYQRPQQRGNGSRLRGAEVNDAGAHWGKVGPCDAGMGRRQAPGRSPKPIVATQHYRIAVHTNGRKPSRTSLHQARGSSVDSWADADTRTAIRNTKLLG